MTVPAKSYLDKSKGILRRATLLASLIENVTSTKMRIFMLMINSQAENARSATSIARRVVSQSTGGLFG